MNPEIVTELLRPIDPNRVGKDGKGFSRTDEQDLVAKVRKALGA